MRNIARLAFIQILIFVAGLACIELALRYFMPLPAHGGAYHSRDGKATRVVMDKFRLQPNLDVIHEAAEFSAEIHTTELGYRAMPNESMTPQFLFLGDSFTFGHGVSDDETFSSIFCTTNNLSCMNLGRSGTSTFDQVRILKYAIDTYNIQPETVVLVMLTACWIDQSGNDLGENLSHYRKKQKKKSPGVTTAPSPEYWFIRAAHAQQANNPTPKNDLTKTIQHWTGNLEITKRIMAMLSGGLKSYLYECSDQGTIDSAITATRVTLDKLERLSIEHDIDIRILAIHPYQELDGSFRKTEDNLQQAIPETFEYIRTGEQFSKAHYFPYDGHFNTAGHANMASILQDSLHGTTSPE